MAEATKIEWCDSTFNPWVGCTKIAPACDHCYAAAIDKRTGGDHWGNVPRRRTTPTYWRDPIRWQQRAPEFYALNGQRRRRVFCASMADVFDNQVPTEWRDDLWELIRSTPDLDWLLLTKRPQNIAKMKPAYWDEIKQHVWLGTTVEDQKHADENVPHLLEHDSAVRFISAEPLLGPINLTRISTHGGWYDALGGWRDVRQSPPEETLDWVIAGGESGPHARASDPAWFWSLRDQCEAAGVAFLFKQWGEWVGSDRPGKKAAGRLLDGIEHNGFPEAA